MERDAGEGPQKSVCLLGSLFTFLRVILAPGGSKAGGGRHVVGACQCSMGQPAQWRHLDIWVVNIHIHTDIPPAEKPLDTCLHHLSRLRLLFIREF